VVEVTGRVAEVLHVPARDEVAGAEDGLAGYGEDQVPSGHAGHLTQPGHRVGEVLEHLDRDQHIELVIRERKVVRVGMQEVRSRHPTPVGAQPRVGQVETDHAAPPLAQLGGDDALAAADLQGLLGRRVTPLCGAVEDPFEVGHPTLGQPTDGRVLRRVLLGVIADDDVGSLRRELLFHGGHPTGTWLNSL